MAISQPGTTLFKSPNINYSKLRLPIYSSGANETTTYESLGWFSLLKLGNSTHEYNKLQLKHMKGNKKLLKYYQSNLHLFRIEKIEDDGEVSRVLVTMPSPSIVENLMKSDPTKKKAVLCLPKVVDKNAKEQEEQRKIEAEHDEKLRAAMEALGLDKNSLEEEKKIPETSSPRSSKVRPDHRRVSKNLSSTKSSNAQGENWMTKFQNWVNGDNSSSSVVSKSTGSKTKSNTVGNQGFAHSNANLYKGVVHHYQEPKMTEEELNVIYSAARSERIENPSNEDTDLENELKVQQHAHDVKIKELREKIRIAMKESELQNKLLIEKLHEQALQFYECLAQQQKWQMKEQEWKDFLERLDSVLISLRKFNLEFTRLCRETSEIDLEEIQTHKLFLRHQTIKAYDTFQKSFNFLRPLSDHNPDRLFLRILLRNICEICNQLANIGLQFENNLYDENIFIQLDKSHVLTTSKLRELEKSERAEDYEQIEDPILIDFRFQFDD